MTHPFETVCKASDPQWLEERMKGVTASELPALLGVSSWMSRVQLFAQKTGAMEREDISDLEHIRLGHILEPVIKSQFEQRTGIELVNCGRLLRSKKWPWLLATPDFATMERGLPVDAKSTGRGSISAWKEGVPPHVRVQLHAQMLVMERESSYAALLTADPTWRFLYGGCDLDGELVERIIEEGEKFMECVRTGTCPEVDASELTTKALQALFPENVHQSVALPPEATEWDAALQKAKEDAKAAGEIKREMENRLKLAIGDAGKGVIPGGATYRLSRAKIKGGTFERKPYTRFTLTRKGG